MGAAFFVRTCLVFLLISVTFTHVSFAQTAQSLATSCAQDNECIEGCVSTRLKAQVNCINKTDGNDQCIRSGEVTVPIGGLVCGCLSATHHCGYYNPAEKSH